jgi:hypothetical protein
MHFRRWWVLFLMPLVLPLGVVGQSTGPQAVQRDAQAITILTQAINVAGGSTALAAIQDFTASGQITYYWAGTEVQGAVVARGRGTGQFRMDATLPNGVRSWTVSNGVGSLKDVDGTVSSIPYSNTVNLRSLTFPLTYLASASSDASTSISYVGFEMKYGTQVHHIRLQKALAVDPGGVQGKLTQRDFFVDSSTFLVVGTLDTVHPMSDSRAASPHEIRFADYRNVAGALVPFAITEYYGGQPVSLIQLSQVTFNKGLTDSDFQP